MNANLRSTNSPTLYLFTFLSLVFFAHSEIVSAQVYLFFPSDGMSEFSDTLLCLINFSRLPLIQIEIYFRSFLPVKFPVEEHFGLIFLVLSSMTNVREQFKRVHKVFS